MLGSEEVEAAPACWYTPGRCSTAAQLQEAWSRACLKRRHLWAAGSWEAMKEEVATPCLPSSRAKWVEGRRASVHGLARGAEVEVQACKLSMKGLWERVRNLARRNKLRMQACWFQKVANRSNCFALLRLCQSLGDERSWSSYNQESTEYTILYIYKYFTSVQTL